MSAPKFGWEPHAECDGLGCEHCNDGAVKYRRPPRWVELLAAIVDRMDKYGSWTPSRHGYRVSICGRLRLVKAEGSGDASSLRAMERKGHIEPSGMWPSDRDAYEPTDTGRVALSNGLAKFERGAADS